VTLKQFVVAVAVGAAVAVIVKNAGSTKGGGKAPSGSDPIEGVGTQVSS
jgi:hypothetical protein